MNKTKLTSWDDFFALPAELRIYLRDYYLEQSDAKLIKDSPAATRAAFHQEWQETFDEQLKDPDEPPDWTVEGTVEESLNNILSLWNSILAILFRDDWTPSARITLFGDWIPIGVQAPDAYRHIQIMTEPFFSDEVEVIETHELTRSPAGLVCYEGYPVLFWRAVTKDLPPIHSELRVEYEVGAEVCDLWSQKCGL